MARMLPKTPRVGAAKKERVAGPKLPGAKPAKLPRAR